MSYDFSTLVSRSNVGSKKWDLMTSACPHVAADIAPFSVADLDLPHAPEIVSALVSFLEGGGILGYAQPYPAYLEAVRSWMSRRHGWEIDPSWVCMTPGIVPAIYTAIRAFTDPGDRVILSTPVYYPFSEAVERTGRVIARNPLILEAGRYRYNFDELEQLAADPRTKLMLLCSPHNPISRVWTRDELAQIAEICLQHDVLLVSDEIHCDLVMPGYRHTMTATAHPGIAERLIACTAPSKSFNIAGLATSNIIIPNAELRARFLAEHAAQGEPAVNTLGYVACRAAYEHAEGWVDALIAHVQHNHEVLTAFFAERMPEVIVHKLEATYLQWLDFRPLGLSAETLERILQQEAFVFLDEGYIFGPEGAGFERMNIACPTDTMLAALERMARVLEQHRGEAERPQSA